MAVCDTATQLQVLVTRETDSAIKLGVKSGTQWFRLPETKLIVSNTGRRGDSKYNITSQREWLTVLFFTVGFLKLQNVPNCRYIKKYPVFLVAETFKSL
jgi:hypothetical protein